MHPKSVIFDKKGTGRVDFRNAYLFLKTRCLATFPDSRDFGRIPGFRAFARGARAGRKGARMALLREFWAAFLRLEWQGERTERCPVGARCLDWHAVRGAGVWAQSRDVLCQLGVKCCLQPPKGGNWTRSPDFHAWSGRYGARYWEDGGTCGGDWGGCPARRGLSLFGRTVFGAKWVHLGQKGAFWADLERW